MKNSVRTYVLTIQTQERGATLSLAPLSEAPEIAQSSERATQPHAVYLLTPNQTYEDNIGCPRTKGWYLYDTPKGRNVALFSTNNIIIQVSRSQNQSAETPYTKMFIPTFTFAAWGNLYLFIVFPCRETICFANLLKIIHI